LRGGGSVEAGRGEQAPGRWPMSASERLPRWVLALGGASARAAALGAGGEQQRGHRRAVAGLVLLRAARPAPHLGQVVFEADVAEERRLPPQSVVPLGDAQIPFWAPLLLLHIYGGPAALLKAACQRRVAVAAQGRRPAALRPAALHRSASGESACSLLHFPSQRRGLNF
jgi:hypothetical protein